MREILFRGKRADNGEWEYGDLWCNPYGKRVVCIVSPINDQGTTGGNEVDPETVGQYTGLTDKNGRKIFEGDIVERGGRIWLVEYSNKYGQFMMTTYTEKGVSWSRSFDLIPPDWCEVIGNIYDNPELLKGGNDNG